MYAEALYPILDSLPEKEVQKIMQKYGAVAIPKTERKKQPLLSDAEAKSYLMKFLKPRL